MQRIILVDNGSRSVNAVLNLKRLAGLLSEKSGKPIDAVPLQHAHKIPPEAFGDALGGKPVLTLPEYAEKALEEGVNELVILPLFFGNSRAISSFIPDTLNPLRSVNRRFSWTIADVLCPLPQGEPKLARLVYDNLMKLADTSLTQLDFILLVDHGSPSKKVTQVRVTLAEQLAACLPAQIPLLQAAMERRDGPEYDFSGPLLQELLEKLASDNKVVNVALALLFISPGRHAGKGGDITGICAGVMQRNPGLRVHPSPLVGDNPLLIDLLLERLEAVI